MKITCTVNATKRMSIKWLTFKKWLTGNQLSREQIRNATQCQFIRFSGFNSVQ